MLKYAARLFPLPLIILAACAPLTTGRFTALSTAISDVLKGSTATYGRIQRLERRYMTFVAGEGDLTRDTFALSIRDDSGRPLSFDLGPPLLFREAVLTTFVKYADTLQAYAKKDYQADLDRSTNELN